MPIRQTVAQSDRFYERRLQRWHYRTVAPSTVVRDCCKDDDQSQLGRAIYAPPPQTLNRSFYIDGLIRSKGTGQNLVFSVRMRFRRIYCLLTYLISVTVHWFWCCHCVVSTTMWFFGPLCRHVWKFWKIINWKISDFLFRSHISWLTYVRYVGQTRVNYDFWSSFGSQKGLVTEPF